MTPRRILLTGAAGRLGTVLRQRLAGRFELMRSSDIRGMEPANPGEETVVCDLTNADAVAPLCEGIDAILHFGGIAFDRPWEEIVPANIVGTINLYEAARKAGVERILLASSNHVVGLYPTSQVLDETSPPRPDSAYGASKAFGEDIAALYAYKHGIRAYCMRIGTCRAEPDSERALSTWLSFDDLERLVMTGLTASYVHEIVYGVSNNSRRWWNNEAARRLGYEPRDNAELYDGRIVPGSAGDLASSLQGGSAAARDFSGHATGTSAAPASTRRKKTG